MRKILFFILFFSFSVVNSQELNCEVTVNSDKVGATNNQVFKTLQKSLMDFVNKTTWTEQEYKPNEKINCSMFITINSFDSNQFEATIQVQSSRTIFNSTYSSPMLNINDKDFNFNYTEFENLLFNPNSFDSNLVSVIAFYSYLIIGTDAESFEPDGGSPYFQIAQDIVNLAAPTGVKGWSQQEKGQNRYFMMDNLMASNFKPYKDALYNYHFGGLDKMEKDLKTAKTEIINSIISLVDIHKVKPNAYLTRTFFDAKADEIVSIFSGGPQVGITELVDALNKVSPINSSKWAQIKF